MPEDLRAFEVAGLDVHVRVTRIKFIEGRRPYDRISLALQLVYFLDTLNDRLHLDDLHDVFFTEYFDVKHICSFPYENKKH